MGDVNRHRAPPPDPPHSAPNNKRKHNFRAAHQRRYHREKRQKSISQTPRPTISSRRFQQLHSRPSRQRSYSKKIPYNRYTTTEANRKWSLSSHDSSIHKDKILVVSYNILGVENVLKHPDLYWKVAPEFLEWDWRKKLICNELRCYNAGILCLQEVDRFNDLDHFLRKDGYRGVYKVRTGEADDGCAIFWKEELFTLLHEENIEFQRFGLRNNVAQFCVLKLSLLVRLFWCSKSFNAHAVAVITDEMIENQPGSDLFKQEPKISPTQNRSIVVGNIHVLFNPSRGDIKLGQVRLFLEKAHKLSQEWGSIPVIIGGDLNSIPQSAIYQFLASSELDICLHDRRNISGQLEHPKQCKDFSIQIEETARLHVSMPISRPLMRKWSDEEIRLSTGCERATYLQHRLKLCSAYCGIPGSRSLRDSGGEPLATSYHSKFMGTVDYIWHTQELVPLRVLETLPADVLRIAGLPNERWGSDHLALVCELAFVDDGIRA